MACITIQRVFYVRFPIKKPLEHQSKGILDQFIQFYFQEDYFAHINKLSFISA